MAMASLKKSAAATLPARARRRRLVVGAFVLGVLLVAADSWRPGAQEANEAAFQLSSSQIYAAKEPKHITIGFRQLAHLDFRVYKVKDPVAFFANLPNKHVLGSPEPEVAQEPTLIERISTWKAARRRAIVDFARRQVSHEYRRRRRAARPEPVVARRVVDQRRYAQVPVLNEQQLVASWREILPRTRDTELRTLPIEVAEPGVYLVEAVHDRARAHTVLVVSDLGLVTKASPAQLFAFVARRDTGEPLADCVVTGLAGRHSIFTTTTTPDGVVAQALGGGAGSLIALARCGDDTIVTDPGGWWGGEDETSEAARTLKGLVYTDRPVYRPGHTVHLRAILRWRTASGLQPFDARSVEVSISDPEGKVLVRESRPVDEFGSVAFSYVLPASVPLGRHGIRVTTGTDEAAGSFDVQEYRKPEFDVLVSTPARRVTQGERIAARVQARYYFGQPVANGRVRYAIYRQYWTSPLRWIDDPEGGAEGGYFGGGEKIDEGTATLDADGAAAITVPTSTTEDGDDYALRLEARVTDNSGRESGGETSVAATHGSVLVVARPDRYLVARGSEARVNVRVLAYDGTPQANRRVDVSLARTWWDTTMQREAVASGTVTTDAEGRATWAARVPDTGGSYEFSARVSEQGRTLRARTSFWVPDQATPADDDSVLELVADRGEYQPGDTARLQIRGENAAGPVLVTKEGEITHWHRLVRVGAEGVVDVPVAEEDIGDTHVNVAFLRQGRLYRAERKLRVPPRSKTLDLTVTPDAPIARPREGARYTIRVLDAGGAPVRAQVSVSIVDEALYAVRPDTTPDPARFFYRQPYSRVVTTYARHYAFDGYSGAAQLQLAARRRPMALADFKADRPERPEVRREFPDAIFWKADLVTGPDGTARVEVPYPDALTTWRLTARATTVDTRVGGAIARTLVTKDVIVRAIAPRFLVEGDTMQLPVIVHNYLAEAAPFDLNVSASTLAPLEGAPAGSVSSSIASRGTMRTLWPYAASSVGRATVLARATSPADGDAVEIPLPVLPYGLRRDEGVSGSMAAATRDHQVTLDVPEGSNPAARSIRVTLAPSLAGSMLSALDWLAEYPYGCTEQTVSSFVPNLLVMRTLDTLRLAPTERLGALDRMAGAGLRRLLDMQNDDGSWGWWKTAEGEPFMTAYALYGLLEARRAGMSVAQPPITRGAAAVARLSREYPRMVPELKAWMAYVLARATAEGGVEAGDLGEWDQRAALDELWAARDRMRVQGQAMLVMSLDAVRDARAADLARGLLERATQKGDLAWWQADGDPWLDDWGDTTPEATALALRALLPHAAQDVRIERALRWLMANRTGSYWYSTKQTAMALYALVDYVQARQERPAAIDVDVVVNGQVVATRSFTPANWTDPTPAVIEAPATAGPNTVRLVKRGEAPVYWSATAQYYDTRGELGATGSRQLALSRRYARLAPVRTKDGRLVYREAAFDGTMKPGDVVLVRLTLAGAHDWRYLVVEDPIPAGTEAVQAPEQYPLETRTATGGWHREYRDARVVFFEGSLASGRVEYAYLLRAVTPGEFRAMPARVVPMYVPGVFASTAPQAVRVTTEGLEAQAPAGAGAAQAGGRP